ncbi:MAG: CAP domain-containing protein [Acidimicrobiales bacterium]|nr:CAP domain-containing protein [Acidimicrobiales bacterium]MDG1877972.1 CAP domain-containing protein [Acidimicrobiales bacterium]
MGRQKLKCNPVMDASTSDWGREINDGNFIRHSTGPYGENVAMTLSATGSTPKEVTERLHNLWMTNGSHFDNMTNDGHSSVGIGFRNGRGGWYATHVFSHT